MKQLLSRISCFFDQPKSAVCRLLSALLCAAMVTLFPKGILFNDLQFFSQARLWWMIGLTTLFCLIFCLIKSDRILSYMAVGFTLIYGIFTLLEDDSFYFFIGCCIVLSCLIYALLPNQEAPVISDKAKNIGTAILITIFTLFTGILCCLYYKNHWTPCYDFGIFAQMFHYMKETGLPLTTCERDSLLNHFTVHFSPVFYLLLPFYCMAPSPCTLLFLQCLVVAGGIVPLVLLAKKHGLSNAVSLAFAALYLLHPAMLGGCFYYLHENNFLAPLILWLLYFGEKEKTIPTLLFAGLLLTVKEDAAVYTAVIALYLLFESKNRKCSFSVLCISIIYFIIVTQWMRAAGSGIMTDRYDNYMYDDKDSLFTIIKAAIQNPAYVLQQCCTEQKLQFFIKMLLPLGFLPLCIKKVHRSVLLIPLLLVNLMTAYVYQFDTSYQYGFGSGALLLYLSAVQYSELGTGRRKQLICAFCCSILLLTATYFPKSAYPVSYIQNRETRQQIDSALDQIPADASVAASTFLLPNLSSRTHLYELETTEQSAEYYALDLRYQTKEYSISNYQSDAFEQVCYYPNAIAVFKTKAPPVSNTGEENER